MEMMRRILLLVWVSVSFCTESYTQELNTDLLTEYFSSLEKRDEAMGSIVISKNRRILYHQAIGDRQISTTGSIAADLHTNYKIWSITKIYTATMIMQLIEENKLKLESTLDQFYPSIPNASIITIHDMLSHQSGLHDFIQNDTGEDWDAYIDESITHELMVENIAQYPPDFPPTEGFRYSNSNYLLLGYIIETLDSSLYETSLSRRISSRIGLTSTYFGVGALDSIDNKAYSYRLDGQWTSQVEGGFSGPIPAGAGGIVSSTRDMITFIEALFDDRLISKRSLNKMMPDNSFYGLGLMQTSFQETKEGYGHTGGSTASESSLFFYPSDSLAIAYTTNGIVIPKEEILDNVLKIYHNQPFGVSMNRKLLTLLILGIGLMLAIFIKIKMPAFITTQNGLYIGIVIPVLFWLGSFIGGFLYGDYNHIKDALTQLTFFYSNSGDFMASIHLIIVLLFAPFIISIFKCCRYRDVSVLPLIPIIIIPISMLGSTLFPFPNSMYSIFANIILLILLGPLLTFICWSRKEMMHERRSALVCLLLMILSVVLVFSRSSYPVFVHTYWGIIQRLLFIGWTLWVLLLTIQFRKDCGS